MYQVRRVYPVVACVFCMPHKTKQKMPQTVTKIAYQVYPVCRVYPVVVFGIWYVLRMNKHRRDTRDTRDTPDTCHFGPALEMLFRSRELKINEYINSFALLLTAF